MILWEARPGLRSGNSPGPRVSGTENSTGARARAESQEGAGERKASRAPHGQLS